MRYSLRSKLTLSYILIVVIVVGLISLVANIYIKTQFQSYVINRQEKQTNEVIDLINMQYEEDKVWDTTYLERIGMNALQNGIIIEVLDEESQLVWSASEHNNGLCEQMIVSMRNNMYSYSTNWKGEYQEKSYDLILNDIKIGTLVTGYVGPYYFNDEELVFIKAFNTLFIIIGIGSLILVFILGLIISLRISKPLNKIAKKASLLSEGKYKEKLKDVSNTKEIDVLIETINNLSEALENKEKLQKQLTQDVAHELRTPLTSVQGHMEAMIDGIWEMTKERLTSCYDEIIRMRRLIGSIEDLSGIENENVLIHKEDFDISKLITRLLNNYENEFFTKHIRVKYNPKEVSIYADQDKMSQVVNNLITNALKYSDNNGEISIDIANHQKTTEIRIKDTGIGIDELDLPHIFERFYRVDKSRNQKTGGVGVGLTITKAIIEAHGGTVTVNSKINEGTEFVVKIPRKINVQFNPMFNF
ncbi:sensor histidine kinase [Cellulosilyticum sp. I15G10I2]|uniref:sensor histidine kinase n=1 Tax=Cellulosilyticum sp. I15G10I2 TaxID=1892843 RepID=UPI00085C236D|nr:HAMP domain-containing sensor histidine kinase [Cellulosilyticum sp. I15G10I2]